MSLAHTAISRVQMTPDHYYVAPLKRVRKESRPRPISQQVAYALQAAFSIERA
jgi:hypothetical protein